MAQKERYSGLENDRAHRANRRLAKEEKVAWNACVFVLALSSDGLEVGTMPCDILQGKRGESWAVLVYVERVGS